MPRFFFHLHDGVDVPDDGGQELPDLAAARAHAVSMARFEVAEAAKAGHIPLSLRIDVEDEHGAVLTTVPFGEAVEVTP